MESINLEPLPDLTEKLVGMHLRIIAVAALLFLSGCSTPALIETDDSDTSFYAYQQCLESLGRYEDPIKCNSVGTRDGRALSYTDYTMGRYLYESDYQATDSPFLKASLNEERKMAYREYLRSLNEEDRQELVESWEGLVAEAKGVHTW